MKNYKLVKTAAAVALGASVVTAAVVPGSTAASAASKYKVSNGKLVNAKTGKVVKGYVVYKSKLYYNGKLKKGYKTVGSGKTIKLYYNGSLKKGYKTAKEKKLLFYNGSLKKGYKTAGEGERLYKDGQLDKGYEVYGDVDKDPSLYYNGYLKSGYKTANNATLLFYNGKLKEGYKTAKNDTKLYKDGRQNVGQYLVEDKDLLFDGFNLAKGFVKAEANGKFYNDGKLATGTFEYEGKTIEVKDGVVVSAEIISAKAVNTKTLEVQFSTPMNVTASDFSVSKDSVKTNIANVTIANDKKSAQIELTSKLAKGDYTVSVKPADAEKALTKVVSVENEKVDSLSILSDIAPLTDGKNTEASVGVQVLNQYGEDITKVNANDLTVEAEATSKETDAAKVESTKIQDGKIVLTFNKAPKEGDEVKITLIHAGAAKTITKTVKVTAESVSNTISVDSLYNKDGKTLSLDSDLNKDEFYLPVNIKDQYGKAVTDAAEAKKEVAVYNSNDNVVTFGDLKEITVNDQKQLVLPVTKVNAAGSSVALFVVKANGTSTTANVNVKEGVKIASATLADPTELVTAGKDILFPLTVTDTNGDVIKTKEAYDKIATKNAVVKSANASVVEAKDKGLFLKVDGKDVVEGAPVTAYIIVDGKNSTKVVTPKATAVASVITGLSDKVSTAVREGKNVTINNTDLVVEDQYGQKLDEDALKAIDFTASVVAESPLTVTPATSTKSVLIAAKKDQEKTSDKVTFKLSGDKADASALAKTFTIVKDADFTNYTVEDLPTVQVTGDNEKGYSLVRQGDMDLVVKAKDKSGNIVTLDNDEYNVTGLNPATLTFAEGSNTAKQTATITINKTGEQFTKEVTFSKEATKVTNVEFAENNSNVANEYKTITEASVKGDLDLDSLLAASDIITTDQFNVKAQAAKSDIATLTLSNVSGNVTFANNGLATATATLATGETKAVVKATVKIGDKTATITVTLEKAEDSAPGTGTTGDVNETPDADAPEGTDVTTPKTDGPITDSPESQNQVEGE